MEHACIMCSIKSNAIEKLNEDELKMLAHNCASLQFKAGDLIIKQDSFSTNVAFIKKGLVKIHTRGPAKEKILNIKKSPAYICLPSSLGDKVNHFSVTALEDTEICFIDLLTFKKFIYENGDFAYQIIMDLSKANLSNSHNCLNNAQKQNVGRVADAILFFAKEIYNSDNFILPLSRQDLADLTGITRESVSRILSDFHDNRIININMRNITILNEALLYQISEKG